MMLPVADDEAAAEDERRPRGSGGRRSVARLAAVQALYQLELNPESRAETVVREFVRHRFGEEIDGDRLAEADAKFFADIVEGAAAERERLDTEIAAALVEGWPLPRLDAVLRAILRAGTWELMHRCDVPPRVSISEYTQLAYAFFTGKEPGLANGVLDRVGRTRRAGEM
jgi:transcription antitermination protein NusB